MRRKSCTSNHPHWLHTQSLLLQLLSSLPSVESTLSSRVTAAVALLTCPRRDQCSPSHQVILAQAVRSYVALEASSFASGASSGRARYSMNGPINRPQRRVLCSQHLHRSKLEGMVDVSSLDEQHDIVVGRRYFNCLSRIGRILCTSSSYEQ